MKRKTVYLCTECGDDTPKWAGKCPSCGAWNTLVEQVVDNAVSKKTSVSSSAGGKKALHLHELGIEEEVRFTTGLSELDRVLGGGAVGGSLVLVAGAPGIGKSTLLLQICEHLGMEKTVLYVTGEESERQLKMRADRLNVKSPNMLILAETELEEILGSVDAVKPDVMIVDSIQTIYNNELNSSPGSVGQVKECTMSLMRTAKTAGITIFIIGHVNKEGAIAGPKVLEHMVDCVLYFEGEESSTHRILRAAKNRFGSTNEIGVFEMLDSGLRPVDNPSELMLSGRPENVPGTCVTCVMEGTRPILAEVQALMTPSGLTNARRNFNGFEFNRGVLLLAVLEKRAGLRTGSCDAYINVIGGLSISEPAADLAVVLAIASSYRDAVIGNDVAAIGEVGLTGELRTVSAIGQRLHEIARLGFKKCIIPSGSKLSGTAPEGLEIIKVRSVRDAINAVCRRTEA